MVVELGHYALILAFCLTLPQAFFGLAGPWLQRPQWLALSQRSMSGQFVFTLLAFGCLTSAFFENDFSVLYVAQNSNSALPLFYRFAAVWGAHEGSLLLWLLVLSTWSLAVVVVSRHLPEGLASRVIGTLGLVSAGFALFILATSNPFERLLPAAVDGRDLNPLLQDPALAIHPPMLYMGYVGFAVPFAFAIAAMMEGKLDAAWARWVRPWATVAWMFLTVGIALGSWWAYYELGWGGWWFWDPVENASFMPWLAGTALIHSLAVTEKRGLFKSWTLLLAIMAFSLSLLGTFLVRSGVLVSVHAFATDPSRGLFILLFLLLCIGGALGLYAWRAPRFKSEAGFSMLSREAFLLINNVLLVAAAGLILVGTLYPLVIDTLGLGKISVGVPYFSVAFLIPTLPLVFVLAPGMHATWKRGNFASRKKLLLTLLGAAAVAAVVILLVGYGSLHSALTVIGLTSALWVIAAALVDPIERLRKGSSLPLSVVGMTLAHVGVGIFVFGVAIVQSFKIEKDLSLSPGQSQSIAGYEFKLERFKELEGPNYIAVEGKVVVSRGDSVVDVLYPQKRQYRVQTNAMTEAGIDWRLSRDLFVAMGDDLGNGAWSMRLQYKPYLRFVWLGSLLMALGGLLAVCDRRYRVAVKSPAEASSAPPVQATA